MITVTMSMEEFEALKNELNVCKEIVEVMMTPVVSTWDLDFYKEHPEYSIPVRSENIKSRLSDNAMKYYEERLNKTFISIKEEYQIETKYPEEQSDIEVNFGSYKCIDDKESES